MINEFNPDWDENAALVEEIQDLALELEQTKTDFVMQADAAMELLKTVDQVRGLLERCLDEMQYAGWNQRNEDNFNRWSVFSAVLNYLHPPVKGDSK